MEHKNTIPDWKSEVESLNKAFLTSEKELLEEFFTFLRFQSISAEPHAKEQVLACSEWVKSFLENCRGGSEEHSFKVETWQTSGHPTIFAEYKGAGPNKPTVLIYNHYDVQPVDPLELWISPPFEPAIRDSQIFARGAQDNKGQCFSVLSVLRYLLKRDGKLPVNVKVLVEGEEETGSKGLAEILSRKKSDLKADGLLVVDMGIPGPGVPAVTLGLRGIVTMTLELEGSNMDLHSGVYGGIVYNPNRALVEILGKAYDSEGRVCIPGFYDDVATLSADSRKQIDFDHDISIYETSLEAKPTGGEKAFAPLESAWARPTFEINGVSGGYSGEGFKTVIPAKAQAKLSCRLVPNQDPHDIAEKVRAFIEQNLPDGIRMKLHIHPGVGQAIRADAESALIQSCSEVFEAVLAKPTQRILCGGSVPVIPELAKAAGAEVALIGYGLDSDNMHAPNEHYGVDRLRLGFTTIGALLFRLGNSAS